MAIEQKEKKASTKQVLVSSISTEAMTEYLTTPRKLAWDPDEWSDHVSTHAVLLLCGWGFFIPIALFTNSHLYRRHWRLHMFGVHFHMVMASIGLILALAGFGYGIKHLSTFNRDNVDAYNMAHAVIGTIATAGAILEVSLMLIMRRPKFAHQRYTTWPWWQKVGHFCHRGFGFFSFVCALVALETGTHISSVHVPGYEDLADRNEKYSGALIGILLATGLTTTFTVQLAMWALPEATAAVSPAALSAVHGHHNVIPDEAAGIKVNIPQSDVEAASVSESEQEIEIGS